MGTQLNPVSRIVAEVIGTSSVIFHSTFERDASSSELESIFKRSSFQKLKFDFHHDLPIDFLGFKDN